MRCRVGGWLWGSRERCRGGKGAGGSAHKTLCIMFLLCYLLLSPLVFFHRDKAAAEASGRIAQTPPRALVVLFRAALTLFSNVERREMHQLKSKTNRQKEKQC